ncbi:MAG: ABC transporter ATP-binding protein, partial [Chitinophagaceae bacterium]|nr:ABC transporter ATP-binding protein [Anaerolineae bacterium]
DERVDELSPSERHIWMVFQYPVVYRGMDVYRNIELPLLQDKRQRLSKTERKARVESVIETLDLGHAVGKDISTLDNGTRQKIAVARAVARQPRIILFDEPITNVDVNSKVQLKRALKKLVKLHSQTIIYVTHDQTEAMTLADEILLMRAGEIVQHGTPRDIYSRPNDRFGGWFLGNPGMNFVEYPVQREDGSYTLTAPLFQKPIQVSGLNGQRQVLVGIRPERVRVHHTESPLAVAAQIIRRSIVVGGQHLLTLQIEGQILKAKVAPDEGYNEQAQVWVECPLEHITLFESEGHRLETTLRFS